SAHSARQARTSRQSWGRNPSPCPRARLAEPPKNPKRGARTDRAALLAACVPETSHFLRPTPGDRDVSRPQPRSLLGGHVHDGEACEVLLALDVRTVGEQRGAARCIGAEHRGSVVEPTGEDEDSGSLHLCPQRADSL